MGARSGRAKPARPYRRTSGSPAAHRALWREIYEKTPHTELPWFDAGPSPPVVRAVEEGFLSPRWPVLDIGCGAGSNVLYLRQKGFESHGVDISPGAVRAANHRLKEAGFPPHRPGGGRALPRGPRGSVRGSDRPWLLPCPTGRPPGSLRERDRPDPPPRGALRAHLGRPGAHRTRRPTPSSVARGDRPGPRDAFPDPPDRVPSGVRGDRSPFLPRLADATLGSPAPAPLRGPRGRARSGIPRRAVSLEGTSRRSAGRWATAGG